ncbi:MAG: beta-propeller fold lactonase family protein [Vicinamibacterales bacterium]|nr:beta-propeller fold lactonase family protein [Vicinamibacterales bacterium]
MNRIVLLPAFVALVVATAIGGAAQNAPRQTTWTFDSLEKIGGLPVKAEGNPKVIDTPLGKAVQFDGVDDSIYLDQHPLAGAEQFTFEAIFRPDGGAPEQRWFHLAERNPANGQLVTLTGSSTQDANARFLFELRVIDGNQWCLDAFVSGPGYNRALLLRDKLHPIGQWYHVASTYDGKMFRSYVNGELQGEAELAFKPQGPGAASVAARMNHVNYFNGAVRQARFTPRALTPDQFLKVPRQSAATAPAQKAAGDYLLFAGSYTQPNATTTSASKGIYSFRFDSKSGTLAPLGLAAEIANPAHVWASPNGKYLYSVTWQSPDKMDTVSAYRIDHKTGMLSLINKVSAKGDLANQVVLDPSGKLAGTVTYNSGTFTLYGVEADGRLSEPFYTDQHTGKPLSPRQPGPKAHGIVFSKDSKFAYVAELGLDRVYSYRVDAASRTATPLEPPFVNLPAGSGPRRLQLHPNGRFLYVNHETDSKVTVFEIHEGSLKALQTLSTKPDDFSGNNSTAEIQIDKEGKWLYVSNRGHDSLALYSVDPGKGTLTFVEYIPSLGRTPRNLTIDPSNEYLFCANQAGENVVVFRIDHKTGHLTPTGSQQPVPQAAGVAIVKVQ